MPKGPKGQKCPADVIGNAVKLMQIATGELEEEGVEFTPAPKEIGREGGKASFEDVIARIDAAQVPAKRGPYKKRS